MKNLLFAAWLILLSCTNTFAQNTFHAILFGDTNDDRIGEGVKSNIKNMASLISDIGDALKSEGYVTKKYEYTGQNCNKANLQRVLNSLNCKDDIVFFYYGGHGGRSKNDTSKFPRMCLGSDYVEQFMAISELKKQITDKSPRLLIVISDCCNSVYDSAFPATRMMAAGDNEQLSKASSYSKLRDLFIGLRGTVLTTGSEAKLYSWYNTKGGIYTNSFLESLNFALSRSTEKPSWNVILQDAKDQTKQVTEECYRLRYISDIQIPYHEINLINLSKERISNEQDTKGDYKRLPLGNGYYYGEVSTDGKRHGRGSYNFDNGQKFEGYFKNDNIDGSGIYFWDDNHFFAGYWDGTNGRTGYGVEVKPDGNYIVGYWQNENYVGPFKQPKTKTRLNMSNGYYEGETRNGKPHGTGKYVWNNGSYFYGNWIDGVINGSGLLYFGDNQGCFIGVWENGIRKATYGLQCLSNGSRIIGFWENEVYRGKSLLIDK